MTNRLGLPKPHVNHPILGGWWRGALERMEAGRARYAEEQHRAATSAVEVAEPGGALNDECNSSSQTDETHPEPAAEARAQLIMSVVRQRSILQSALQTAFRLMFGVPGQYKVNHPLWINTHRLARAFRDESVKGATTLWVSANPTVLTTHLARLADARITLADLNRDTPISYLLGNQTFDACFFDVEVADCMEFNSIYRKARDHVRNGGRIYLNVVNLGDQPVPENMLLFCEKVLPDTDISEAAFMGGSMERQLQTTFSRVTGSRFASPFLQRTVIGVAMLAFAPFVYAANRRHLRQASYLYMPYWLNLFARFTVVRRENGACDGLTDTPIISADHVRANLVETRVNSVGIAPIAGGPLPAHEP
jgi:hypothetical protein